MRVRLVAESGQSARFGLHWLAAYRAPRRVDSTSALCVKNKCPPETIAIITMRKKDAVKANSTMAVPRSDLLCLCLFIYPRVLFDFAFFIACNASQCRESAKNKRLYSSC